MATPQTIHQPNSVHIGINAHLLSGEASYRRAGIHQYIYQVLRHLPRDQANALRYLVYTRQIDGWEARPDMVPVGTPFPTENRLARIAWERVIWPRRIRRDHLALVHSMAFVTPRPVSCPVVVTIYDLSFVHYPDDFPPFQRRYLLAETARSCRDARQIIAISESGRRDLHERFHVPLERIAVVRPGVDRRYRPLPERDVAAFRARQGLPARFLLHVGTLQPRKNIPLLLQALARLNRPGLPLILVGGKGWIYETIYAQVQELGLGDRVHFAGYVPDEELPFWYNAAAALVCPSRYEGFGLPVVEALACGTPVLAANTSSLPEAGGPAALYFDPRSAEALADLLASLTADEAGRDRVRQAGPAQAARFSWEQAGRETAAVYRHLLAEAMSTPERQTG